MKFKHLKKTIFRKECRKCKVWFDSETKFRHVCDKCKSEIDWGNFWKGK